MKTGSTTTDNSKTAAAELPPTLWRLMDRHRDSGRPLTDAVAPLAGLLVLRWAAHVEAEQEAVAAFDDRPFAPLLPESLSAKPWQSPSGMPTRIVTGLEGLGAWHDGKLHKHVGAVAPTVLRSANQDSEVFSELIGWVAELDFDTDAGRNSVWAAFEELLAHALAVQGRHAGEFTTPSSVVELMVELADPQLGDRVYDPCFGVGGLLVSAVSRLRRASLPEPGRHWREVTPSVFGVELNSTAFTIALCRLVLAGVQEPGLELGDALGRPLPKNRAAEGFDCILASPPWGMHVSDAGTRQYPVPSANIENLFLQHVMANLRPGGRAVVALPEGTLFRSGADRQVRKTLLEEFRLDGVVALPEGAFAPCTAIPASLIVFQRDVQQPEVRFVSVSAKLWKSSQYDGAGYSDGYGVGNADGSGSGLGTGYGAGEADGSGFGNGTGFGRGTGDGGGFVDGTGAGSGSQSRHTHSGVPLALLHDVVAVVRRERTEPLPDQPGIDSWDADIKILAKRDYELLAKRTGADELESMLGRVVATEAEVRIVPLRQVCESARGISYNRGVTTVHSNEAGAVGILRVGDFSDLGAKAPSMYLTAKGAMRLKASQILRAGDIAVSISGTVGKVAIISDVAGTVGAAAANGVVVIRCKSEVQASFLAAILRAPAYQKWMCGHARGATIQHLSIRTLRELPVPVSPVAMQDAVVRNLHGRGDALSLLLHHATRGTKDPLMNWLERPGVVSITSEKLSSEDVPRLLSDAGKELRELRPLRNQVAHGDAPDMPEVVVSWLLSAVDAGAVLVGIDAVPAGAPRIAALELAGARLDAARRALGSDEDGGPPTVAGQYSRSGSASGAVTRSQTQSRTSLLNLRLRGLTAALRGLIETATNELLGPVRVRIQVSPAEIVVGVPTEVRLELHNESRSGLRSVRVVTKPDIGRGSSEYLAEGRSMAVPLTACASDSTHPLGIRISWEALRLDGRPAAGSEELELLVHSTRHAVLEQDLGPSPYIVGNPVDREEMFFGREDVLDRIKRQLGSSANANVILLEGNRRTGKTSILRQLQKRDVLPGWIPVYCSFQDAEGHETRSVFRLLARTVGYGLFDAGVRTWFPGVPEAQGQRPFKIEFRSALQHGLSGEHPFESFEEYLVSALEAARPRRILLMLDEFDWLQDGIDSGATSPQVPENIRHVLQHQKGVSAILTGSRRLKRLREEYWSALFGLGYRIGISALPMEDAQRLVTEPVAERLSYLPAARDRLVELCALQPFLVQSLCNRVFEKAAEAGDRIVTPSVVAEAATDMVQDNEHFRTLWDYAQTSRRRLILALCEKLVDGPDPVNLELLSSKLESCGVRVARESHLGDDLQYLRELELIEFDKEYRGGTYRVAIPLLGMWIRTSIDFDEAVVRAREEAEEVQP